MSPSLDVPVARRSFDSVPNLIRRAPQQFQKSANWRKRASAIDATRQLNTEHKARPYRSQSSDKSEHSIRTARTLECEDLSSLWISSADRSKFRVGK
jgi:hypothetical protein